MEMQTAGGKPANPTFSDCAVRPLRTFALIYGEDPLRGRPLRGNAHLIFNVAFEDARTVAADYGQKCFLFGKVRSDGPTSAAWYRSGGKGGSLSHAPAYLQIEKSACTAAQREAARFLQSLLAELQKDQNAARSVIRPIWSAGELEGSLEEIGSFLSRAMHRRTARERHETE